MKTMTSSYNDVIVRLPNNADTKPLQAFVEAMGWHIIILQNAKTETTKTAPTDPNPVEQLCGMFKTNETFDYKQELYQALKEKYQL